MYRTHNDLVVRTVDWNEKPIEGVSVMVSKSKRPIPDSLYPVPAEPDPGFDLPGIHLNRQKRDLDNEDGNLLPDNLPELPVKEEGESEVEDEADENNADESRSILTNELGEATFPRHPVGSVLVIEVKAKTGYAL